MILFQGNFVAAKDLFEKLGMEAKDHRLLHFGAPDHFFKACLCALAMDHIHANVVVKLYKSEHPAFEQSRHYKFVLTLIECLREDSVERFDLAVESYRMYSTMHPWLLKVLQQIRSSFSAVSGWNELEGQVEVEEKHRTNSTLNTMLRSGNPIRALYLQKVNSQKHSNKSGSSNLSDVEKASSGGSHTQPWTSSYPTSGVRPRSDTFVEQPSNRSVDEYANNPFFDGSSTNPFYEDAEYREADDEDLDLRWQIFVLFKIPSSFRYFHSLLNDF